ncbi:MULTISPECIES: hypothetical protein [Serratia]|nr:hypothetical protein [Serratia marcescens]MDQ9395323.1 hypothetical protein [Serratia marcescens]MDQ9408026.1 hypothetical protein [Serratia marcescens]MDQ9497918.1 hypothetical protein [Serratia marcescens]MDQ9503053.1 hypothetical protein [Serratia marcescens]MDQ9508464.1 hypothetical protein [Serratia marcescens]
MPRSLSYPTREIFNELERLGYTTLFFKSADPADFWEEEGAVIVDNAGVGICYYAQITESDGSLFQGRCPMSTYNRWHFFSPRPAPNNAAPTRTPSGTSIIFNNGVRSPLVEEIIIRSVIYENFM